MPAEALVAVTVEVFGLAPVVDEVAEDAGVFEGVFELVFEDFFKGVFVGVTVAADDEVAAAEVGFSVFSFPTCGVAGGVWFR